jgi:hypothetical protein
VLAACFGAGEWKLLEEHVVLLSKRRGQMRQVIQSFVRQAMGYIDKTPDKATKVSLIKTLQTVTEGKVRRARRAAGGRRGVLRWASAAAGRRQWWRQALRARGRQRACCLLAQLTRGWRPHAPPPPLPHRSLWRSSARA